MLSKINWSKQDIQSDPAFVKNIGQIVLLGGAFAVNGNVNPAAEANIFGDPHAADVVFTSGADVLAMGINVTHQVILTDSDRDKLAETNAKFAKYLCKILDVYFSYHHEAYSTKELEEVQLPLEEYASLKDFFVRMLKGGSRPIDSDPYCLVSPVDDTVMRFGELTGPGAMIEQVKGFSYSASSLIGANSHLPMLAAEDIDQEQSSSWRSSRCR